MLLDEIFTKVSDVSTLGSKPYYGGEWKDDDSVGFILIETGLNEFRVTMIAERELGRLQTEYRFDEDHTGDSKIPVFTKRSK